MLKELGITPNAQNLYFLKLWSDSEGTAGNLYGTAVNNPLAITDPSGNWSSWETGNWNSVGVKKFDSPVHGGVAAAKFLKNDSQNTNGYINIINSLKSNSLQAMWKAVNQSRWCYGCGGGTYPMAVYSALGSTAPKVGEPLSSSSPSTSPTTDGSIGFQGPIGPGQVQGSAESITCGAKGKAAKFGLGISISQCNVKALTGGMITILGVQMLFLGVVVVGLGLGLKTKTGQTVKRTAVRAGKTAITKKLPSPKAANASQAARDVGAPPPPPAPPMAPRTAPRTVTAA